MAGKTHLKRKSGRKAEKKKAKDTKKQLLGAGSSVTAGLNVSGRKQQTREPKKKGDAGANPKAFAFQSGVKAKAYQARSAEKEQRRLHAPLPERVVSEPPPLLVLVHGPPQVGKTTLIKGLVKHYTKQNLSDPKGPITLVTGKKRRITLLECPPDLPGMMDAAKVADLVLLLIDGSFGLEMETFEFLNLLQVHGFPKVMGVLTHLDGFKEPSKLKKAKKALKARFWSEVYDGAKLFYLSGMQHGKYLKREILNLARFISVVKTRPLTWRLAHPYMIADRFEDVTPAEPVRLNPKADRELLLYGYLRGAPLRAGARLHLAGVGDFDLQEVDALPDPCPLPHQDPPPAAAAAAAANGAAAASKPVRRRTLSDRDRLIHAPMSDVGGMLFDRDAVYIDLPDWKVQYSAAAAAAAASGDPAAAAAATAAAAAVGTLQEGEEMVRKLQGTKFTVDEKLSKAKIQLFTGGSSLESYHEDDREVDGEVSGSEDEELGSSDLEESQEEDDEGDSDDSEEEEEEEQQQQQRVRMPAYESVPVSGRTRRRALFETAAAAAGDAGEVHDHEYEGESDEEGEDQQWGGNRGLRIQGDEDLDDHDDHSMGAAAAWKSKIQERAASIFATRGADLASFIYGTAATAAAAEDKPDLDLDLDQGGEDHDEDNFFTLKGSANTAAAAKDGQQQQPAAAAVLDAPDAFDTTRPFATAAAALIVPGSSGSSSVPSGPGFSVLDLEARWGSDQIQGLRNRFVTGDWAAAAARAKAMPGEGDSEEGEGEEGEGDVLGDFEDVEAGLAFTKQDAVTAAAQKAIKEATADELRAKKIAKRAAWDAAYAEGGAAAAAAAAAAVDRGDTAAAGSSDDDQEDGGAAGTKSNTKSNRSEDNESYFDAQKREMAAAAAATAAALAELDPATRVALAGHAAGTYVRLRLTGVPYELVTHWDPTRPLLVGGLGQGEQRMGVLRLRFKRHRWYPKILKTRDPLILSVGWRRFQTMPVYALEDHNRRLRALKYTPQHMHCLAAVHAPLAPPNTGVVCVQAAAVGPNAPSAWRIAATAVVVEQEAELRIVKKLKLVGTPMKIAKHSAFIGGMFTSQLEASRFEGAAVITVSGIRGTIKKALRPGVQGAPDGGVRVTFEDKPLMSDIVFLRAWVAVDIPKLYNTMTNLLAPAVRHNNTAGISRRGHAAAAVAEQQQQQHPAAAAADPAAVAASRNFVPAARFSGARPGYAFKSGSDGLGYYRDTGSLNPATAAAATAPAAAAGGGSSSGIGWIGMKMVAELRREAGVGAPRNPDSLYRPVERAPKVFNPLKIPAKLQAALPFKTKPKIEAARKRKTLEQKRAVVLDKPEKKAATLLQQLNAIRNAKAEKRRAQATRRKEAHSKKQQKETEWREKHNKDQRKDRYVQQGQAAKRAAAAAEGGGKFKKQKRK